jgi:hypothetical protein
VLSAAADSPAERVPFADDWLVYDPVFGLLPLDVRCAVAVTVTAVAAMAMAIRLSTQLH